MVAELSLKIKIEPEIHSKQIIVTNDAGTTTNQET